MLRLVFKFAVMGTLLMATITLPVITDSFAHGSGGGGGGGGGGEISMPVHMVGLTRTD